MSITVIDYGSGNLKSAAKALETAAENLNLDTKIVVTSDPKIIKTIAEIAIINFFVLFTKKFLIFSFLVFLFIIAISSSIIKSYFLKRTGVFLHFYNILTRF